MSENKKVIIQSEEYKYTVQVSRTTVRKYPLSISSIKGTLTRGTEVKVIKEGAIWTEIVYKSDSGFVKTKDLNKELVIPEEYEGANEEVSNKTKGLFSWKKEQTTAEMREDTLFWLRKFEINELYQSGLFRIENDTLINFVGELNSKGINVYNLTGDATWFNKVDSFKKRIDQVKEYNSVVEKDKQIKGVVFDVEPWVLGEGNWTQKEFAVTVKVVYAYARECGVEMVMVIPFWLEPETSDIIIANSDKTIVMNYNIKAPVKFIKEEIDIAKKYNKKISTAAETKKSSDEYGVDSTTTYYYVGADRLKADWKAIDDEYQYDGLEFALHDMTSIKDFYELYKESIDASK